MHDSIEPMHKFFEKLLRDISKEKTFEGSFFRFVQGFGRQY